MHGSPIPTTCDSDQQVICSIVDEALTTLIDTFRNEEVSYRISRVSLFVFVPLAHTLYCIVLEWKLLAYKEL